MDRTFTASLSLAILAALIAAPASAQSAIDTLEDALGKTPLTLLEEGAPHVMYFADMAVLRERIGEGDLSILARYAPSMQSSAIESLGYAGSVETWEEKAGLSLEDIDYIAGGGMPPDHVAFWRLDDPQGALDALADAGFEPVADDPSGALANGTPGVPNIAARDPQSPWSGMTGQTAVVTPAEGGFVQSLSVDAGAAFAEPADTLAQYEGSAVALAGIAQQMGEGDRIAQAFVLSPLVGLPAGDPAAALLSDDPQAAVEAGGPDTGLPPFTLALTADIEGPDARHTLLALAYGDCDTAETAGERFVTRWDDTTLAGHSWSLSSTTQDVDGGCAALISIADADEANPAGAYGAIFMAIGSRDFTPLTFEVE